VACPRRRTLFLGSSALAALAALSGCATFGGNVKGSFSCAAPDGICAPSSSIDDRALAMITGETGGGYVAPASSSPVRQPGRTASASTAGQQQGLSRIDPRRTQERVLRIVFQPYIDELGRLHEASAVHAVVQNGEWEQQALAYATPIPDRNAVAGAAPSESLLEAVDRAVPAGDQAAATDPDLPDAAAVAAARARRADPVKAIQNDVAARLAPKAGRTPGREASVAGSPVTEAGPGAPSKPTASPSAVSALPPASAGKAEPAATPASGAVSAGEAVSRIKASPEYQARAADIEGAARAAGQAGAAPDVIPTAKAPVRAAGFPAAVPEEN